MLTIFKSSFLLRLFGKHLVVSVCIIGIVTLLSFGVLICARQHDQVPLVAIDFLRKASLPLFLTMDKNEPLPSYLIRMGIVPRVVHPSSTPHKIVQPAYNDVAYPLFITMADASYLPSVRNFKYALAQYHLDRNFIIVCLDDPCVQLGRSQGLFLLTTFVNMSVAKVKFDIDLDLSRAGFDFILFDSDVYLTQYYHPLAFMDNITDPSWDLQFQPDGNDPKGSVNIGWFWSRPSPQTIKYFDDSRRQWLVRGGWDQAVMNNVLGKIELSGQTNSTRRSLLAKRLDRERYVNFMLTYWSASLSPKPGDPHNFYALPEEVRHQLLFNASSTSVIWHYTCVEKSLKSFLAKYFGQWTDFDGYYTTKRKFLSLANVGHRANSSQVLLRQFLIGTKLAVITGRTLILPDSVFLHDELQLPIVRAVSIASVDIANVSYVESTFLYNRQNKHQIKQPTPVIRNFSLIGVEKIGDLLRRLISDLQSTLQETEAVTLDFASFNTRTDDILSPNFDTWWRNLTTIDGTEKKNLSTIRLCQNIGHRQADCLKICQ